MLQVSNSEHNLGMFIEGDYHDMKLLYQTLNDVTHTGYFRKMSVVENYIYSLMHEVRLALQGKREFDIFQNNLDEDTLAAMGVDDLNIYYGIHVFHIDMLFTLSALMHLPMGRLMSLHEAYLRVFIEVSWNAYKDELNDDDYKNIYNLCVRKHDFMEYYHQYLEVANLKMMQLPAQERLHALNDSMDEVMNKGLDYERIVEEVDQFAKDNNCEPHEITYFDSTFTVEW